MTPSKQRAKHLVGLIKELKNGRDIYQFDDFTVLPGDPAVNEALRLPPLSVPIEKVGVVPWGGALTGNSESGYRHMVFGSEWVHLGRDGFIIAKDEERC